MQHFLRITKMIKVFIQFLVFSLATLFSIAQTHTTPQNITKPLKFTKKQIASESFESVDVFDVNNDKIPDIVSGAFWYEGPGFWKRNYIGAAKRTNEYYDDFSTIPLDVNGDGRIDFVTGGWFGKVLSWRENPGNTKEWVDHEIAMPGNIETTRGWDIDGDGTLEIVPNTPNDPLTIYHLLKDSQGKGAGRFETIKIGDTKSGHGLGFGDVNGDGRNDFILSAGWLEAPINRFKDKWTFHEELALGTTSIPVIVVDVNKDGLNDLIAGQAHGYGIDWYEQKKDKKSKVSWIKHSIDPFSSQYHTMEWIDIDGDGKEELITGKRYRAHNGNDPGENDPLGIYYFKWNGEAFTKQVVSYGEFGEGKGTGLYFTVADLTGSGRKDIIVAGKDGLYVFYNKGF
jgi:hypothetical protein